MDEHETVLDAENQDIDSTLDEISANLQMNETLVLDLENNILDQTDRIYDTLVMRGFEVRKAYRSGKNQIIVTNRYKSV